MLPAYTLTVNVTAKNINMDEKLFHELVDPSLNHLEALKGAFDRKPCTLYYYPPFSPSNKSEFWSCRGIVLISIGKVRAEYLIQLYQSISHLIELELSDFEVQAEINKYEFS